jgi:leader peptidase (prepilin peptidase) / N-methyltransferase
MTVSIGVRPVLIAFLAMVAVTAILIVTDLDHFRIPNRILYPGTAICFVLLAGGAMFDPGAGSLVRAVAGAAIYFGLLLLVFIAARGEGFGFGDVKLAALLGMFSAFQAYRVLAWSLIITAVLGAIPAVVLLLMGKGKKASIPYGPPLILGAWSAIIFATSLLT